MNFDNSNCIRQKILFEKQRESYFWVFSSWVGKSHPSEMLLKESLPKWQDPRPFQVFTKELKDVLISFTYVQYSPFVDNSVFALFLPPMVL